MSDMNGRVAAYAGACSTLASKYSAGGRAKRMGAEYDDLYQEGLISVWQAFERGVTPSIVMIENRMKDWLRYLGRQTPVPYEALLPLDDFRFGGAS